MRKISPSTIIRTAANKNKLLVLKNFWIDQIGISNTRATKLPIPRNNHTNITDFKVIAKKKTIVKWKINHINPNTLDNKKKFFLFTKSLLLSNDKKSIIIFNLL